MNIALRKFGTTLTSRQLGQEAFKAFKPSLNVVPENERIEVDFSGVITFSPSWGDEFLTPLLGQFGERVVLINTNNSSVKATLELLDKLEGKRFKILS
ncbi:MAG: DUF4325 domain-containing protein [Candidatus Gracilibacteria bacterium]|jgi:hypothetical protein